VTRSCIFQRRNGSGMRLVSGLFQNKFIRELGVTSWGADAFVAKFGELITQTSCCASTSARANLLPLGFSQFLHTRDGEGNLLEGLRQLRTKTCESIQ
jgi:hypothetical protein